MKALRHALRSAEPLDFLLAAAGLLEATDPRRRNPFQQGDDGPSRDDLIESFMGTPFAETTAMLTAIRALTTDEVLAARIGRELDQRRHPLPEWLARLDEATPDSDVWFMTHVLGDGDDYVFAVTLPTGHPIAALVYVDHNMGTVVKDAFLTPATLTEMHDIMAATIDDQDQHLTLVDPARARAVVEEAIAHGAMIYPPLESETWPMCRPIVEWMLRGLPSGGVVHERPEWTDEDLTALADRFFASPFGQGLDDPDNRDLLDSILWFGASYTSCDPLRWSEVNVEILLLDWVPRKIEAEARYLAKLPNVLRAYIRFCHAERGIRTTLTASTLAAVDQWEPEYQRTIRSTRLQGPAALLADFFGESAEEADRTVAEIMLEGLDRTVGGRLVLMSLDDAPLPDEEFLWAGIADDIKPVVQQMLDECDRVADELLDVEHRTAMRRLLSRAAVGDAAIFRRKASPTRGAAAVAWVIAKANGTIGGYWSGLTAQELLAAFGLTGSVSSRANPLLRAIGIDPHHLYGAMRLGSPDLLTSRRRAELITSRDRYLPASD